MHKFRRISRRQTGVTSIVEFGPTLWIVLIMVTFPLLAFGTIGMRYCFVNNAVQYAAEAGACSRTFYANSTNAQTGTTYLSATNAVSQVISKAQASWNGITPSSIVTNIVITPYAGGSSTITSSKLTAAQMSQSANNLYTCQVVVTVSLQPLFPQTYFKGLMACPGLSAPLVTTVTSSRIYEYPQGLGT